MTDYLNNSNQTTLLFKKFQNKTQAGIDVGTGGTSFFNESNKSLNNIYNTDIFIENIEKNLPDEYKLSSLDACANILPSVWNTNISDQDYSNSSFSIPNTNLIFYKGIYLDSVSATNNAWWFIPPEFSDQQITDNNLLKDMIPFNFNPTDSATFSPIVKYWNGTEWTPQPKQNNKDKLNWLIDYASGILQFYQNDIILNNLNIDCNSSDEKKRPRISFIKYVGRKGLENFLGGGGGSLTIDISGNISANNISTNVITSNNNIINENLWKQIIFEDGFIYNLNSSYTPPYITNLVPHGSSINFSNNNRNIDFNSTTSSNEYVALSIDYYFYIPQQFFIQFTVDFNNGLFFNFYENAGTTSTALNYQGNTLTYTDRLGATINYNLVIQMTETVIIWYDTTLLNIYKLTASNLEKIASIDNFYSGESFFSSSTPKNMNFKIGGSGPSASIPMGTSISNLYINNYSPYFKFIEEFEYNLSNNQLLITNDINIKSNLFVENKIKFFNDENTINITTHRKNIISESLTRNSIEIGHQYYRNHSRFSTTYQKKDFINIGFFSNAYLSNMYTAQIHNLADSYPEKTIIIGNYNCEFFKGGTQGTCTNNVILGFNCFSGPDNTIENIANNVVIGTNCGYNMRKASGLVLIGREAGYNTESISADISNTQYSIAIGYKAGYNRLHSKCIILNGDGNTLVDSNQEESFYVHPIRAAIGSAGVLQYDSSTNEVTYSNTITATSFIGDGSQLSGITDTTYSAGTGVTLSGTTFSIGQAVATNSNVQFNSVNSNFHYSNNYKTIEKSGTVQSNSGVWTTIATFLRNSTTNTWRSAEIIIEEVHTPNDGGEKGGGIWVGNFTYNFHENGGRNVDTATFYKASGHGGGIKFQFASLSNYNASSGAELQVFNFRNQTNNINYKFKFHALDRFSLS